MQDLTRRDAIVWGASLAAGSLLPAAAQAKDINLTLVSASPVQFIWNKVIADVFVPEVTKAAKALGDNIAWKQLYGTTVKRGGEIQAVRDGVSEMAFPTMTAYVSELPLQNISYVPPYGAGDMGPVSAAMHELNLTDPGIAESYQRYENTYICNYVTPSYQLWTKFPVNSVADIKGVKLGCSGLTTGWIKGTGAVPVEQHIPGFYNDIKNGVFDGALTWLWVGEAVKLAEVAPYVTIVNFGAVCPSIISINSKVWAGFSPEAQSGLHEGRRSLHARGDRAAGQARGRGGRQAQGQRGEDPRGRLRGAREVGGGARRGARRMGRGRREERRAGKSSAQALLPAAREQGDPAGPPVEDLTMAADPADHPAPAADSSLRRRLGVITLLMNNLGTVTIAIGMVLVCGDVFARNLFNAPFFGIPELLKMTIIAIVFLQLPHAVLQGRMIRSDVLLEAVSTRSRRWGDRINAFHMVAGALFLAAIIWGVWPQLVEAFKYNTFVGLWVGFRAPVWPIRTIIVVGALLGAVAYLLNAWLGERKE